MLIADQMQRFETSMMTHLSDFPKWPISTKGLILLDVNFKFCSSLRMIWMKKNEKITIQMGTEIFLKGYDEAVEPKDWYRNANSWTRMNKYPAYAGVVHDTLFISVARHHKMVFQVLISDRTISTFFYLLRVGEFLPSSWPRLKYSSKLAS